jgi:phosphate transport system substrate-binding protein
MYTRVLVIVWLGLIGPANANTLRAGGVGAVTKLLPILYAGFGDAANLEVIPSLGSSGGLRALAEGALDVAVSGRPLNAEEVKQGMRVVLAMRTPFVLVTSHPKPNGLKSADIAEIFRAQKSTWADGSLLHVILRPKSDTDTSILGGMFPGMVSAIESARTRQDVPVAATDQDNADAAERISGSLTGSTLTQIKTEQRPLRLLSIDGVTPSLEALESGAYPFSKTIYFILPAKNNPSAEAFVAFLRSPAGQAMLRGGGNLVIPDPGKP